jgi:Gpi18-like mannosyltransferase
VVPVLSFSYQAGELCNIGLLPVRRAHLCFFSLTASILLFELTRLDFDRRTALTAVWFLNIFPTAYFLQSSYTESLFLTLSIGTIYCFRNKLFARSALLGALATATRPNGVMLIPVLFMEAMAFANTNVKTERDHWFKTLATLSFISLGLLGYLAINYFGFGTPFYFLKIQSTFQSQNITWPWVGIQGLLATLHHAKQSYGFAEFAAIAFGGVSIPYLLFKVRKSYALYVLLNWLLMASSTFILSRPRYLLILFPIYMMLGKIRNKWILILISLISSGQIPRSLLR